MSVMKLPNHIAIIPDGNGRWAKQRFLPRVAGHKVGVDVVLKTIGRCVELKINILSFFAFSSENWGRPSSEVNYLMDIFKTLLQREIYKLHEKNIQLHIIGDRTRFSEHLKKLMTDAEDLTKSNTGLNLVIALNYGGRWDICEAVREIAKDVESGKLSSADITTETIQQKIALGKFFEPDILIRTSGEQRISNFLLWQMAYTELYFTDTYWPDFNDAELDKALTFYANRDRRYGCVSELQSVSGE